MLITPPFAVIDFEASSLSLSEWPELSSYPIEVGVATGGIDGSINVWSSLIRPPPLWIAKGEWDRKSERVHGLSKDQLGDGQTPIEVARALNALLTPLGEVWCDGGAYDAHWLSVLYATTGLEAAFGLKNVETLLASDAETKTRYVTAMERVSPPHRAGPDAKRICEALSFACASS